MSKKQFSIRLEKELYEQIDNLRWERRKSLNDIVNEAVKEYLEKIQNQKELKGRL